MPSERLGSDKGRLSIVHLSTMVGRQSFGLGAAALNLASTQLLRGWDTRIWCLDTEAEIASQPESQGYPSGRVFRFPYWGPASLGISLRLVRAAARDSLGRETVFHQHG